jgi:C-terminal processing protease CtpA/Prc
MRLPFAIAAILLGASSLAPLSAAVPAKQSSALSQTPLSAAERQAVIHQLAGLLRARYVDPATGQEYAEAIKRAEAAGQFSGSVEASAFAARLTEELAKVRRDKHLRVTVGDLPVRGRGTSAQRNQPDLEARWAAQGVAYLAIHASPGDPAVAAQAQRMLLAHAGAKALILDLRQNKGGTGAVMEALLPYFFDKRTSLVMMDTRAAVEAELGQPDEGLALRRIPSPPGVVRREHVALPHASETRFFNTPIYVLTSSKTASVAEHLTLALQRTGRAIVIGETTSGAGHYGHFVRIGQRFVAFIPFGQTFDPTSGKGWEATGIAPNVPVAAADALEFALARISDDRARASPETAALGSP